MRDAPFFLSSSDGIHYQRALTVQFIKQVIKFGHGAKVSSCEPIAQNELGKERLEGCIQFNHLSGRKQA